MHIKNQKLVVHFLIFLLLSPTLYTADWIDKFKGTWGLGASILSSNYVQADKETTLSPYIFGSFGTLQIEANRILYPLYSHRSYTLLATGNYRSHQLSSAIQKCTTT